MDKKTEFLEKFYEIRNKSGKAHLFYSINKVINRIGGVTKLDKIYISKDDYFSNPKANNYYAIFDQNNHITEFTFQPFTKAQK